ncbi:uncharacterized protein ACNLHF_014398 isoform 1-T1 [Anomaloglossus baeobatrachus]
MKNTAFTIDTRTVHLLHHFFLYVSKNIHSLTLGFNMGNYKNERPMEISVQASFGHIHFFFPMLVYHPFSCKFSDMFSLELPSNWPIHQQSTFRILIGKVHNWQDYPAYLHCAMGDP